MCLAIASGAGTGLALPLMLMQFLSWIEQLGLSTWVRESSSLLAYPTILFLHTAGLAFLVGPSIPIASRVLGFAPSLALSPLEKFYPIMWGGFWINAVSGIVLLMADATTKVVNVDFYIKMAFIFGAVVILKSLRQQVFHNPALKDTGFMPAKPKIAAVALLVCWTGAIAAGRLMAYLGSVAGAPGLQNRF